MNNYLSSIQSICYVFCLLGLYPASLQAASLPLPIDSVLVPSQLYIDPLLETLMQTRTQVLLNTPVVGYRIQLYAGPNRVEALNRQARFSLQYPSLATYMGYYLANYQLRVGDFISKEDAEVFRKELIRDYNIALIVPSALNAQKIYRAEEETP